MAAVAETWNVAVETDGYGAYRARCMHCSWCSVWYERPKYSPESYRNALAVRAAKEHGASHAKAEGAQ